MKKLFICTSQYMAAELDDSMVEELNGIMMTGELGRTTGIAKEGADREMMCSGDSGPY